MVAARVILGVRLVAPEPLMVPGLVAYRVSPVKVGSSHQSPVFGFDAPYEEYMTFQLQMEIYCPQNVEVVAASI